MPWNEWIYKNIPKEQIKVIGSTAQVLAYALQSGCGLSFIPKQNLENNPELSEIDIGPKWGVPIWLLVHRDLINIPKIGKFVDLLRKQVDWPINVVVYKFMCCIVRFYQTLAEVIYLINIDWNSVSHDLV